MSKLRRTKTLLILLTLLALVAAAIYALRAPLSVAVASRFAAKVMATDVLAELPDGLHLGLCGAGSPFPDEKRAGPCTLIVAGKRLFVFDSGAGSVRNIGKMGFVHGRIEALFLTHFHSDHIDAMGELMLQRWVSVGNKSPLPVYGPEGVDQVLAGFLQAYAQDKTYRVAHHGDATVPASGFGGVAKPFVMGADGRVVVLKEGDLEIVAFTVAHAPVHPAVGYRISYKGRTVVLSGDTKQASAVQRESAGVDVLVHEALSPPLVGLLVDAATKAGRKNLPKIFDDILDYHATPEQAAHTAREAKARYLLLNHIVPPLPLPGMEAAFLGDAPKLYSGPIRVGLDGDFISLLSGSTEIKLSRRF